MSTPPDYLNWTTLGIKDRFGLVPFPHIAEFVQATVYVAYKLTIVIDLITQFQKMKFTCNRINIIDRIGHKVIGFDTYVLNDRVLRNYYFITIVFGPDTIHVPDCLLAFNTSAIGIVGIYHPTYILFYTCFSVNHITTCECQIAKSLERLIHLLQIERHATAFSSGTG